MSHPLTNPLCLSDPIRGCLVTVLTNFEDPGQTAFRSNLISVYSICQINEMEGIGIFYLVSMEESSPSLGRKILRNKFQLRNVVSEIIGSAW